MSNDNSEFNAKVKSFINSLNPEQKKALYSKLSTMPEEKRNSYLNWLITTKEEKDRASKGQEKVQPKPQAKAQPKSQPKSQTNPQQRPQSKPQSKPQPKAQQKPQPRKTSSAAPIAIVLVLASIALIAVCGISFGWFSSISSKFIKPDGPSEVSVQPTNSDSDAGVIDTVPVTTAAETTAPTSTPTPTPAPTMIPIREDAPDLTGLVIVIDPGHQAETDNETESAASWLSLQKKRCTDGCVGVTTGVTEYELTLDIALIMKDYLEQCGATVILTRSENDVNISNQERAAIAVENNADVFIRLHADGANDASVSGVNIYVPDSGNYTGSSVASGDTLGQLLSDELGVTYNGTRQTYLYTGLNYANTIPSYQVCLGYLSNSDDEAFLLDPQNQLDICAVFAIFCASFK